MVPETGECQRWLQRSGRAKWQTRASCADQTRSSSSYALGRGQTEDCDGSAVAEAVERGELLVVEEIGEAELLACHGQWDR